MEITIGADGKKNTHVAISGFIVDVQPSPASIVSFASLQDTPKKLRIDSVIFAIQEKMGFNLWWLMEKSEPRLIMPLESRGYFSFDKIESLSSPEDAVGIGITAFKVLDAPMSFFLMLDLTKQ